MESAPSSIEVGVLLPVHNAGAFLRPALESLAAQQGVRFEVIAVDDGSTDGSREALQTAARSYPWLKVIVQDQAGVARTLNRAWAESQGEFVARMDADDVAMPDRFARQVAFLRGRADIGVCASWFRVIDAGPCGEVRVPIEDVAIRARMVFGSPFAHPSVMMRRSVLVGAQEPYDPGADGMEDYELWLRLAERTRFHCLPQVLLAYRRHAAQVTFAPNHARRERVEALRVNFLERRSIRVGAIEARAHAALGFEAGVEENVAVDDVRPWLGRIATELPITGWSDAASMRRECGEAWWRFVKRGGRGVQVALRFWREPLVPRDARSLWRAARLALRR